MTDLVVLLRQFTVRYRTALVAKAAVIGLLGLGLSGLLTWRFSALGAPFGWAVGVPASLATAFAVWLGAWVRRRWLSQRGAAAHLDRELGLQQRLITAEEFAQAPHQPPLYPLLLEDAARQYATGGLRLPKPFDHTAGILAIMVLLLLLWPRLNSVLPPFARQPEPKTPPPPQPPPPVQEPRQEQERQQGASSSQQSASGAQGADHRTQQGGGNEQNAQHAPQQPNETQRAGDQSQESGSSAGQQPSHPSATGPQSSADNAQAAGRQQQSSAGKQDAGAGSRPDERENQGGPRPADDDRRGGQAGQSESQSQADAGQGQAQRKSSSQQGAATGAGQSGQSSGEGEALKAEIQELLKEVSGELKNLQAQLSSATDQPKPEAGTGTDPNLYEAPMSLEEGGGGDPLSIQLQTDASQTNSQRPGSGVGRPSGEVSRDAPRTEAQGAPLSEQPLEETPASRQPVPAEYRSVFDRLRHQEPQPASTR